jgi:hypothetical protein
MVTFSLPPQGNSGGDGPAGPPGERVRVFQAWALRRFPGTNLTPNIHLALGGPVEEANSALQRSSGLAETQGGSYTEVMCSLGRSLIPPFGLDLSVLEVTVTTVIDS